MTWQQRRTNALRQCVGLRIAAALRIKGEDGKALLVLAARDLEVLKSAWIVTVQEYRRLREGLEVAYRKLGMTTGRGKK